MLILLLVQHPVETWRSSGSPAQTGGRREEKGEVKRLRASISSAIHPSLPWTTPAAAWADACGVGAFPTVLLAAGGAAGAYLRAVPVPVPLSVSVCQRMIRLLFPQLA